MGQLRPFQRIVFSYWRGSKNPHSTRWGLLEQQHRTGGQGGGTVGACRGSWEVRLSICLSVHPSMHSQNRKHGHVKVRTHLLFFIQACFAHTVGKSFASFRLFVVSFWEWDLLCRIHIWLSIPPLWPLSDELSRLPTFFAHFPPNPYGPFLIKETKENINGPTDVQTSPRGRVLRDCEASKRLSRFGLLRGNWLVESRSLVMINQFRQWKKNPSQPSRLF